jgi:hypothetical protein
MFLCSNALFVAYACATSSRSTDLFREDRHATPFCISEYLRNRPRAGGTTSQDAKLLGCHVKIASSGAKHKPNPTGGAEGSEISGLPKAGQRTKTQRFRKKGVLEGLHKEIGGALQRVQTGTNLRIAALF